jgi:hypothetical protein
MTASDRLGPVRAMRRFADAGYAVLNHAAPFNHRSEVPESAGLRPANYGEETLPIIGKVEAPTETGG